MDVGTLSGAPFLLGKYELTQGQVRALGVEVQALGRIGKENLDGKPYSPRNPEESITIPVVEGWLPHFELRLPTWVEWERGARAGSGTVYGVGDAVESLQGCANVADATLAESGMSGRPCDSRVRDGFMSHAPVGTFAANAFGLHDMLGNVAEITVAQDEKGGPVWFARGGSYMLTPLGCRVGSLRMLMPNQTTPELGLRVCRDVPRW